MEVCGVELPSYQAVVAFRYMPSIEVYHTIRDQCPHELIFLFDTLADYCHPRAKAWLPETIEVIVTPADESKIAATDWPSAWPDIQNPATRSRRDGSYSLFLDVSEWKAFQDFLDELRGKAVRMGGRTWWVTYRFPFPGEALWKKNTWRYPEESVPAVQ
jgi:hypothetical protein